VESLLEIENLPEATKDNILTKSEGNPFFIEEVIRSLIEQDMVYREDDHWKARDEIAGISVPDTIQSVVLARVDRLASEARYVLQCASVIGRLFRHRLLKHISHQEQKLDQYIDEFEAKELIYEERTVPELEYAFKHAFTQEATYEGILEQRRREFHHQVAVEIERLYQERLDEYYEELAHHYSRSENAEKGVEYLLKAGQKAKQTYANEAAISYFQKSLDMLEQHGIERNDWRLEAQRGLGELYLGIGKNAEAVEAFEKAIVLAKEIGTPPHQLVRLYHWISEGLFWQSRSDEMIRYGKMGLEILGDDTECLEAALMNSRVAVGNLLKGNHEIWGEYTHRNMEFIKKPEYSVQLRSPYTHIIMVAYGQDRDLETAWEWAIALENLAEQHHDLRGLASAWMYQGHILANRGDYGNALSLYQKTLEMFGHIGDDKHVSWCHENIASILFNSGNTEEAEKHTRAFLRISEYVGNPRDIAWAHKQLGDIAACRCCWEEAIAHFQKYLKGWQSIGRSVAWGKLYLGFAYLKKCNFQQARQSFEAAANKAIEIHQVLQLFEAAADGAIEHQRVSLLCQALCGLEAVHRVSGTLETFMAFCHAFKERHADALQALPFHHWYLESAVPSEGFPCPTFTDGFETEAIDPVWRWINKAQDREYKTVERIASSLGGLEIRAANGRDLDGLNVSAPRLIQEVSVDFAVEVCLTQLSDDRPQQGGLLIWKDRDNFIRFDRGTFGMNEMRLVGYVNGKHQISGRGILSADRYQEVYLRLERIGDEFTSYCSADGENWLTCGKMKLPMDDPIQVGIHAIGMIDRTVYCGEYKEGTATVFRNFRIWTRG
jgi:tetratricopeptide (TPR) repeat protein/regulation of enolase protein 1 (concanavalin A-like superfamily)